jgi:hypothetical protein
MQVLGGCSFGLAQHDHSVHATDISKGMQEKLIEKSRKTS